MNKNNKILLNDLGLCSYKKAWEIQENLLSQIINQKLNNRKNKISVDTKNHILFVEHSPVITIGKSGDDKEQFRYSSIKHTGNIDPNAFPILLNEGIISLDYTIKEKKKGIAKDQGYLFKISSKNLDMLFSSVKEYKFN